MASLAAVVAHALFLDVVIETALNGSPVRWWLVAVACIYAVVLAVVGRRMSWASAAAAGAVGLMSAITITAWLPHGLTDGVRLLGLSTSIVLSLTAIAGLSLAGMLAWRAPRWPSAARWTVAAAAAYGVVAFALAIFAQMASVEVLHGKGLWAALPLLLHAAVLAGVVVLPITLTTVVVRSGVRQPEAGTTSRAVYQIVALATTLALVVAALPLRNGGGADVHGGSPTAGDVKSRLAILDRSFRVMEDGDRGAPRDRWDPQYVVDQLGRDPQALSTWVRENTLWIPYHGVLRGPIGVLMDRQGNSLDRALLLAALLEKAGHTVRLARSALRDDEARALLPRLIAAHAASFTPAPAVATPPSSVIRQAAQAYALDGAPLEKTLATHTEILTRLRAALDRRVTDQRERLLAVTPRQSSAAAEWDARLANAVESLRDHWWVQRREGSDWINHDLLTSEGSVAAKTAQETYAPAEAPANLYHDVEFRVVGEQWSGGTVTERTILAHRLRAADVVGQPAVLQFWPTAWLNDPTFADAAGAGRAAAEQTEWGVALLVDDSVVAASLVNDRGEDPDAAPAAGGGPFAILGQTIAGTRAASPDNGAVRAFTAAWIEYEVRAPGTAARTYRRPVFDLVGSNRRGTTAVAALQIDDTARETRGLALLQRTEILPLGGQLAPEVVQHRLANSLVANRELLRRGIEGTTAPRAEVTPTAAEQAAAPISPLYAVALARTEWSRVAPVVFVGDMLLLTRDVRPVRAGGTLGLGEDTEILAAGTGVSLAVPDAFSIRLEQGVVDANVAHLLRTAVMGRLAVADAFATIREWSALSAVDAAGFAELAKGAGQQLQSDLAAGYVVVAPHARISGAPFYGWWRIDPTSGQATTVNASAWIAETPLRVAHAGHLDVLRRGLLRAFSPAVVYAAQGGAADNAVLTNTARTAAAGGFRLVFRAAAKRFAQGFIGNFAFCAVAVEARAIEPRPGDAPAPNSTWFQRALAAGSTVPGECIGDSIVIGLIATLPILWMTMAARVASAGLTVRIYNAGSPGSASGGRGVPPVGETPTETAPESQPPSEPAPPDPAPPEGPAKGPYRGDPVGRNLMEQNPDSQANRWMGGKELFDGADNASQKAYDAGRKMGMSDEAAHDMSRQAFDNYLNKWRPALLVDAPVGKFDRQVVGPDGVGGPNLQPPAGEGWSPWGSPPPAQPGTGATVIAPGGDAAFGNTMPATPPAAPIPRGPVYAPVRGGAPVVDGKLVDPVGPPPCGSPSCTSNLASSVGALGVQSATSGGTP